MSVLQRFGFNESRYERPAQRWVCGRAGEGRGCTSGPDRRGECRATFECYPNRVGDRWQCTRDPLAGGRCEDGPHPDGQCSRSIPRCLPVRSLRYRRGRLAGWLFIATLGVVLALLTGPWRLDLVSAGDLSFAHGGAATQCGDCHAAAHESLGGWLATALDPPTGVQESRRCVNCHRLGAAVTQPHSVPRQRLEELTREARQERGESSGLGQALPRLLGMGVNRDAEGNLACVTCHREHQGQDFDLTRISDDECQACHVTTFDSLGAGHPEISGYAFERRTRLVFDHLSHRNKHYPEQERSFECADCHSADLRGQRMLVASFTQACGACHAAQIEGEGQAGDKGIRVLGVPGLDLYFVRDHGVAVGEWPEDADADLPPIMHLLLSADERFVASEQRLAGLDLLNLEGADPQVKGALEDYAWSIKRLFQELEAGGQEVLRQRLERCLNTTLGTADLAALTGLLPPEVISSAQQAWFPHLAEEMARHGRGEPVPYPDAAAEPETGAQEAAAGSDAAPGSGDILGGEDADVGGAILGEVDADASGGDILGEGAAGGDILGGGDAPASADAILGADSEAGGDILGAADTDSEAILGDGAAEPESAEALRAEPGPQAQRPAVEAVGAEDWVRAGGWYRQYYTLLYRPSDHDDRFMPGWLNVTGHGAASGAPEVAAVFRLLADPKGPGLCTKCHSVDAAADGALMVNWTGLRGVADEQEFTEFRHVAHLSLLEQQGCLLCHNWAQEEQGDFLASYEDTDPTVRVGNFAAFDKATCTECHAPDKASDSCLTCHNYHVGIFPPGEILQTRHEGEGRP
jgi:hypothetical protein